MNDRNYLKIFLYILINSTIIFYIYLSYLYTKDTEILWISLVIYLTLIIMSVSKTYIKNKI